MSSSLLDRRHSAHAHQPLPLGSPVPPPNPPCSPAPLAQETARLAPAWLPRSYGRSKAPLVHTLPELRISTRAPSHLSAQPQLIQLSAQTVATHILSQRWHSRDSCSVPCLSPSCDSLTCLPYQGTARTPEVEPAPDCLSKSPSGPTPTPCTLGGTSTIPRSPQTCRCTSISSRSFCTAWRCPWRPATCWWA